MTYTGRASALIRVLVLLLLHLLLHRLRRHSSHILVIPIKPGLIPLLDKARPRESMKLSRIHDQLRWRTHRAQGLVHLLAALHRNIEVFISTHEQCRRLDPVRMQERVRQLHIQWFYLPT